MFQFVRSQPTFKKTMLIICCIFQGAARTLGAAVQGASSAIQQQWQPA